MTPEEVLCALDALTVQTGSLACLGCGHEHNCGIHGCAIIREAARIIRGLSADNRALRYAIKPAKVKHSQEQEFNGAVAYLRAMIKEQRAQIEKLEAENAALRKKVPQWISVEDRLPEPEMDVLIVCNRNGCIFVTPAIYENGKMLTQDSAWNWTDIYGYGLYSEEDDDYFIPAGWWENRQFNPDDVYNNPVDCAVTHWMALPGQPMEGGCHE